ncbi:MAG: DUF2807 domain-containing protein [Bacteroidales bacterium]|nr:DUF2807 domain-containing protein [Bacteroidales bacterium]
MKRFGIKTAALIVLVFSMVQCTSWEDFFNCVDGNGLASSEVRYTTDSTGAISFTTVKNASAFDVEIFYGDEYEVEVFADQNLLPYINTYISGEELIIETEYSRCLNSNNPIKVEVHMPDIEKVELSGSGDLIISKYKVDDLKFKNSGSGDIIAWNFECSELNVNNSGSGEINLTDLFCSGDASATLIGSGDIVLAGIANKAILLLTGSGHLRAEDFPVEICSVSNSGSGNVYCHVNQMLNIMLTGSGNISYYGTPEISQLITGSGHLISAY